MMTDPSAIFSATLQRLAVLAPTLGAVVSTMLLGLLLSWLAARATGWLVRKLRLDAMLEQVGAARVLYSLGLRMGVDRLAARVAAWSVLLLTASVVMDILGLTYLSTGLAGLVVYVPRILTGLAILVAGMAVGDLMRKLAEGMGRKRSDLAAPKLAGDLVYYIILAITVTLAAEQIGLDLALIHDLLLVGIGTIIASLGLSFALAGQQSLRSLIARHYAEQLYLPGDAIQIDEIRGVLARYDTITATLVTDTGDVTIPCVTLLERAVHVDRVAPADPADDDGS